jgi:hypothetical protein
MAKVKVKTSAVVNRQVPEFVRELDSISEGGSLVKFLEAYYEWLEQNYKIRELENLGDIDETLDEFVEYFADQFLQSVPKSLVVDKRIIIKHAKEIYLAKGTPKAYDLLFRMMFNESPQQIYFPKVDMLRVSDGKWSQSYILRGTDVIGDSFELIGQEIFQDSTGIGDDPAFARVEAVVKYNVGTELITEITLNNASIIGVFEPNQPIRGASNTSEEEIIVNLIPFVSDLQITSPGKYYTTGDFITIAEGDGVNARAEVGTVKGGGINEIFVASGGDEHFVGQPILFDNTNAGFGNSSEVQSAVAEVTEVDFGCFLLESVNRWQPNRTYSSGAVIVYKENQYEVLVQGNAGTIPPTHDFGTVLNGEIMLRHMGSTSGKLVNENSREISLERRRVYKVDQFGVYDDNLPDTVNDGFGPIRDVKIINPGSSYNKLPKVVASTDFIKEIRTTAGTNVITIETFQLHELLFGQRVTVSGTVNREADGTFAVDSIINPFVFTIRARKTYDISGTIADRNLKQVLYADRSNNLNAIRRYSSAQLYAISNDIGSVSSVILPNFGYFYNTVRLTTPVFLQVERPIGNFTDGEEVTILPQSFCTEINEDELLLETGDKMLLDKQQNPVGVVDTYDPIGGILRLSPASNRTGLLLEDGSRLIDEDGDFFVHEQSGVFNKRNFLIGDRSGTKTRIVDVAAASVRGDIGAIGLTTGEFLNSDGKVSDSSKRIQDSLFYQDFSYVIRIGQSVNKYRDAVKKLLHPVGLALFGEVSLINLVQTLTKVMNNESAILTNKVELKDLRAKVLAVGNWQESTNRLLIDNSGRYQTLEMEGGFRDVFITEDGDRLLFEDGSIFVSERTAPDGRSLILESGDKILAEEQRSKFFNEHLLQEFYQFFRLETDKSHAKSRDPFARKEQWTVYLEDFAPSYSDSDTLKLETARVDANGKVIDPGSDLLLEDGGRFLNQLQLSKPAPSVRVLQSEMLPPVIINESDINTVRLLEMSPQVLKEFVFRIKSRASMYNSEFFVELEDPTLLMEDGTPLTLENGRYFKSEEVNTGKLLEEDGSKFGIDSKYPRIPNDKSERNLYVECNPSNVELDNLLLENGDFLLSEETYPSGTTFVATIDAANIGSMTLTGSAPKLTFSSEPIAGMEVVEGLALSFTQRINFGEGVFEEVDYREETVTFKIRLSEPLQATIETTPLVSLFFKTTTNKFKKDDQNQQIYRSNFSTVFVSYKDENTLGRATVQSRASFRQVGSALSFLEQRKFNFPPYTYGSKGSLQVVPGNAYIGVSWEPDTVLLTKEVVNHGGNAYEVIVAGTTGSTAPTHTSGTEFNGTSELRFVGPTKKDISYLPDTKDGGLTGSWYDQYPEPNRSYWNDEYIEMEDGSRLLSESGDEQILEVMASSGDTQIKDFANVSVYDIINRKHKRTNFAVGAYVEVYKAA